MIDGRVQSSDKSTAIELVPSKGKQTSCGTYVLRLKVRKETQITLGRFGRGEAITFPRGNYLYVGSALAERGATTLARRLLRHATRSGDRKEHAIATDLISRLQQLSLLKGDIERNRRKRLAWHVDYLLDCKEVDLIGIYAIQAQDRIESRLAELLEDDLVTSIVKKGIGATDVPGNTHLLRVDADEIWWRLLPLRMQSLVTHTATSDIVEGYLRGRHCLPLGHADSSERVSFARGTVGHQKISHVSETLGVAVAELKKDAQFAVAVETLVRNCGDDAVQAIFFSRFPQSRKSVEMIARTSVDRQRYRVDGVLSESFRSVGPQSDDAVYDTVRFSEVISRLGRAAGLLKCWGQSSHGNHPREALAVHSLFDICHVAAITLQKLLAGKQRPTSQFAVAITREGINHLFIEFAAEGGMIGKLKAALKLTVKNVWDFNQMTQLAIAPTMQQRDKALAQIDEILATTKQWRSKYPA